MLCPFNGVCDEAAFSMKMMSFRIDDVCPQMDQARFTAALDLLRKYGIKPLLGIIPDNQDPVLRQQVEDNNFWGKMRQLRDEGYLIAMHGFKHVYDSQSKSLLTGGTKSEFAGHAFEAQVKKITSGIDILRQHNLDTDIFFAPAHSFDKNTLIALHQSGFRYISDGRSRYCYERFGLVFIPCRSYRVAVKCNGVTTVALHPSLNGDKEYETLKKTLVRNKACLVSFSALLNNHAHPLVTQLMDEYLYVLYSRFLEPATLLLKKVLRPIKRIIRLA
jgi:predicted deacetylase